MLCLLGGEGHQCDWILQASSLLQAAIKKPQESTQHVNLLHRLTPQVGGGVPMVIVAVPGDILAVKWPSER